MRMIIITVLYTYYTHTLTLVTSVPGCILGLLFSGIELCPRLSDYQYLRLVFILPPVLLFHALYLFDYNDNNDQDDNLEIHLIYRDYKYPELSTSTHTLSLFTATVYHTAISLIRVVHSSQGLCSSTKRGSDPNPTLVSKFYRKIKSSLFFKTFP